MPPERRIFRSPAAMGGMSRKPASFAPETAFKCSKRPKRSRAEPADAGKDSSGQGLRSELARGPIAGLRRGLRRGLARRRVNGSAGMLRSTRASRGSGLGYPQRMPRKRLTLARPALLWRWRCSLPRWPPPPTASRTSPGPTPSSSQKSDDLRAKIAAAVGPDYTVGSKKSEQARVWIRSWLEGVTEDPEKRILTIEHTATEFKSGMGDEVNIYYFGREATSRGPAGGNLKVTVAWQGDADRHRGEGSQGQGPHHGRLHAPARRQVAAGGLDARARLAGAAALRCASPSTACRSRAEPAFPRPSGASRARVGQVDPRFTRVVRQ